MESFFYGEKGYGYDYDYNCSRELDSGSKEIDLTLKLSPCWEKHEEKSKLKRSSTLPSEAEADEKGLVWLQDLKRTRRAESGNIIMLQKGKSVYADSIDDFNHFKDDSYNNIPYIAPQLSTREFLNYNIQKPSSTKHKNHDSMISSSNKTIPPMTSASASVANAEIEYERFKRGDYSTLKDDFMEIMKKMLSVRTTGPNGKIIEGFLYKYKDGKVSIVCVCHGIFFTPKEFIVHASGKQVSNPMQHITVYTKNPFSRA